MLAKLTRDPVVRLCGLTAAVYRLGKGRIILNTLRIRENLGSHPVAERLLRNMLIYAADGIDKPLAD